MNPAPLAHTETIDPSLAGLLAEFTVPSSFTAAAGSVFSATAATLKNTSGCDIRTGMTTGGALPEGVEITIVVLLRPPMTSGTTALICVGLTYNKLARKPSKRSSS
jgi:hypothetical protein